MRFVLDNDVDAAIGVMLRSRRHQAWSVAKAGRADGADVEHAVYAHSKGAAFITHDAEFTQWRARTTIGQQVRLCCQHIDAVEVLERWLDEVVQILERHPDVVIYVKRGGIDVRSGWE